MIAGPCKVKCSQHQGEMECYLSSSLLLKSRTQRVFRLMFPTSRLIGVSALPHFCLNSGPESVWTKSRGLDTSPASPSISCNTRQEMKRSSWFLICKWEWQFLPRPIKKTKSDNAMKERPTEGMLFCVNNGRTPVTSTFGTLPFSWGGRGLWWALGA